MSGKSAHTSRQQERSDWVAAVDAWRQVLKSLDTLDAMLLGMGERDLAQRLLQMSWPMSVEIAYAAGRHGVQV